MQKISQLSEISRGFGLKDRVPKEGADIVIWYSNDSTHRPTVEALAKKLSGCEESTQHVLFYEYIGEDEGSKEFLVFKPEQEAVYATYDEFMKVIVEYKCGCCTVGFTVIFFTTKDPSHFYGFPMNRNIIVDTSRSEGRQYAEEHGVTQLPGAIILDTQDMKDIMYHDRVQKGLQTFVDQEVKECSEKNGEYCMRTGECFEPCGDGNYGKDCRALEEVRSRCRISREDIRA